jgi:hypothetical protein
VFEPKRGLPWEKGDAQLNKQQASPIYSKNEVHFTLCSMVSEIQAIFGRIGNLAGSSHFGQRVMVESSGHGLTGERTGNLTVISVWMLSYKGVYLGR